MSELPSQMQEKMTQEKTLSLPSIDLHTKVFIDKDGYVEKFEQDIEKPLIGQTLQSMEDDLNILKDLGLNVETQEWESRDGEDFAGYLIIRKEELNEAIQKGLLKLKVSREDDEVIEIEKTE